MVSPVDSNEVRLTGDNSFLVLQLEPGGEEKTRASHWVIRLSPAGPGHVLFIRSDLMDDKTFVYGDNIALARWLQQEIERAHPTFSDQNLPVLEADFDSSGDLRTWWTERVLSYDSEVSLTWYDLGTPFINRPPPGTLPGGRPHGIYSLFIPAGGARLLVNGVAAQGRPFPTERAGVPSSTSCLAVSETWVRPR